MDVWLRVAGPDEIGDTVSLIAWLRNERDLQGAVRVVPRLAADGEMGGAFEMLSVALGSGGAGVALAHSLSIWIAGRRADVKLTVTARGRTVELDARRVPDAQSLIREVLGNGEAS